MIGRSHYLLYQITKERQQIKHRVWNLYRQGKHKARVFKSALGITAENVDELIRLIRQAAIDGVVVQELETALGREFKLDWTIPGTDAIELRTIWILSQGSIDPQLVSAFIK